jgi:hypothetical protein
MQFVIKVRCLGYLNQGRSGEESALVLRLRRSWEKDGFVSGAKVKTALTVETLRELVRFIDEQAD